MDDLFQLNTRDPNMSYDTDVPKDGSTSAAGTMVGVSAGIQALGNIASAMANVSAFKAQVEADTKARIANMNNVMDSFEYNSYKLKEAHTILDSQFSDKVSERLLKSMKDTATARLMAAESGGSGGDIESGLQADEMFDVAVINSQRQRALGDIYSQREMARMNAVNQVKSLATGGVNVKANGLVSAMSGATNSLGSLLMTMPESVRVEMFGMNTQGTKTDINASKPQ
jgi:hypothetical protein